MDDLKMAEERESGRTRDRDAKRASTRATSQGNHGLDGRITQSILPESSHEAAHLIRERRTIRKFVKQSVPEQELTAMLKLAADTVTLEHDKEALRFIIFASEEGKRKAGAAIMAAYSSQGLYRLMPGKVVQAMAERVAQIPLIMAVIIREGADPSFHDRQLAAASAIVQSFTLLAWERKLGLVWNTEPIIGHEALTAGLGLAEDEQLVCLLYIGGYDKLPKGKRRTPAADKWTVLGTLPNKEDES
ncbi:nitroreductase family protein [Paenibacillus sp. GM2]|uniref:nitroreductase family protein n=1 Tax=Paenibacillus sp. GM2 TaxID=1622070 RepID=UPI00083858CF|nr:nitroreductase family protein [Paenibacillus sp. GM2]